MRSRKPKPTPPELLSRDAVLAMLDGDKPLPISTLYRWMKSGRFPRPPPELLSRDAVLAMLGGDKPLHISTLYRWMESGRFPRPVKVGRSVRWVKAECEAVLRGLVDARGPV